jgi:hypothetical protein
MTTVHTNKLVEDYLRRLEHAATPLSRSRRAELVAEIREHIDDALLEAGAADEVAVRNVLERLGPSEEIAAAAGPAQRHSGRLELAAMITLALPFIGWVVGVALVGAAKAWTGREKAIAIALGLVPVFAGLFVMAAAGGGSGESVPVGALPEEQPSSGSGLGPIELAAVFASFLAGPLAAVYLGTRLRHEPSRPSHLASA